MSAYRCYRVGERGYYLDEGNAVVEMLFSGLLNMAEGYAGAAAVTINLNDLFVPGADSELLLFDDIEPMYHAFCDPRPHALREWLCQRYGMRPWREKV